MRTRRLALTLFLIVTLLMTSPGFAVVAASSDATVAQVDVSIAAGETADVVIILKPVSLEGVASASAVGTLKAGASAAQAPVMGVLAGGGIIRNRFWMNNSILATVDSAMLSKLASTPGVERIIPNFKVYVPEGDRTPPVSTLSVPPFDDPPHTWGLEMIGAPAAWSEFSVSGSGVTVAVLDTGADPAHPDLAGKIGAFQEWDADGNPIASEAHDSAFHGTHVSGTIAGGSDSDTAIGVAPGVTLLEGLVLPGGSGYFEQVIAGMQWAVEQGADVVNMSLGADYYGDAYIEPVRNLIAAGIVPAIAIGNAGPGTSGSPGNVFESWGIGAVGPTRDVAFYSSGELVDKTWFDAPPAEWPDVFVKPDFSAPGGDGLGWDWDGDGDIDEDDWYGPGNVLSALPDDPGTPEWDGGYTYLAGTSMATPHVAGAAALMVQWLKSHPAAASGNPVDLLFGALQATAEDRGTTGPDDRYGFGLINVRDAIQHLASSGPGDSPNINLVPDWPAPHAPVIVPPGGDATVHLDIQNTGDADLNVASISLDYIEGVSDWINMTGPDRPLVITPGNSVSYNVTVFDPGSVPPGHNHAEIIIESNDPDTGFARAGICFEVGEDSGSGGTYIWTAPEWPDPVFLPPDDYSDHPFGLTVGNGGGADLELFNIWVDFFGAPSAGWARVEPFMTDPITIPPGGDSFFGVIVNAGSLPPGAGEYFADVVIESDDPGAGEIRLPLGLVLGDGGGPGPGPDPAPHLWVDPMEPIRIRVDRGSGPDNPDNQVVLTVGNDGSADLDFEIGDRFRKGGPGPMSAAGQPEPQGSSAPRVPAGNDQLVSAADARPADWGGGRSWEGDNLVIGVSDFGELDWASGGRGFEYKPARADSDWGPGSSAESIATGWNGEGYVVYYDGMTRFAYPDNGGGGIIPDGRDVLVDNMDELKYKVGVKTDDNTLKIKNTFTFPKHGRSVILSTEIINNSPRFIGDLRYKRVVDWDANNGAGDDVNWFFDPDYFLVHAADPPSGPDGEYYSYAMAALGDSWPMVYDWDLDAWDDYTTIDHGWSWMQNGPGSAVDGDLAGALYFALGSLAPGERRVVNIIYTVGEGASAEESYEDLLTNLGTVRADVPWLTETPSDGTVAAGEDTGVTVSIDARGLNIGRHFAEIVVRDVTGGSGGPRIHIPVEIEVTPPIRWMIDDPEDVEEDSSGRKVDVDSVGVQVSGASVMFFNEFYGELPMDFPLVSITMLDTDEEVGTGYTGPMSNDIGADYMAFGFIFPSGPGVAAKSAASSFDVAEYARSLPAVNWGLVQAKMMKAASAKTSADPGPSGQLYIFKWNAGTQTWDFLMETFTIGLTDAPPGEPQTMWQLLWLVTMVDDGSMKVVQSAGDIWDIYDTAPDRGHGGTIPETDIAVSGLSAESGAAVDEDTFLSGDAVTLTATVGNEGDQTERDIEVDFKVYPILDSVAIEPGEPGYPGTRYVLGDALEVGTGLVDSINPGDEVDVSVTWTPAITAASAGAASDGLIHAYLLKASTTPLGREMDGSNNEDTLEVDVQVGTEVGLSGLSATEEGSEDPVETAYTGLFYELRVTVTNNGALPITEYPVDFYVGGEFAGFDTVDLESGESAQIVVSWTPTQTGLGVFIEAEGESLDGEIDYEDNYVASPIDILSGIDVAVNSLTVTPSSANVGDTVTLTANVSNQGQAPLVDVDVVFTINEQPVEIAGAAALVDLAPGETTDVVLEWVATAGMMGANMTVAAVVEQLEGEDDNKDNGITLKKALTVNGTDVGITDITVRGDIRIGRPTTMTVTVVNVGTTTPSALNVYLYESGDDDPIAGPMSVRMLRPGLSRTVTFRVVASASGSWALTAAISPAVAGDINPDNDSLERVFTVASSVADVAVTGVELARTPLAGRPAPVKVTVANQGTELARFTLELYQGDELVRAVPVVLPGGRERTLPVSWRPAEMGSYTLTAKVRDGDIPDDRDSEDRVLQTTAMVWVPFSLKVTASEVSGPNRVTRLEIQVVDRTGRNNLELAGLPISLAVPSGAMASASSITTDASGKAVIYVTLTGGKATITINAGTLAKKTIVIS